MLPVLLGVGRLPNGYGFMALSLIRGTPLSKLPAITPNVAAAAEAALAQVRKGLEDVAPRGYAGFNAHGCVPQTRTRVPGLQLHCSRAIVVGVVIPL